MEREFKFPTEDWQFAGSNSYGLAMLYNDMPKVVVKQFPENERALAEETYQYLKACGIVSAVIKEVTHVDGKLVLYVFSERREFLAHFETRLPRLKISA